MSSVVSASYDYLEEFEKLENPQRWLNGKTLLTTYDGYFKFENHHMEAYTQHIGMLDELSRASKFYLSGFYSQVYEALDVLIQNGLHHQIEMLDIEINWFDIKSRNIEWNLFREFRNLKLLNVNCSDCNNYSYTVLGGVISSLPAGLEALCINYHWFDSSLDFSYLADGKLKVLKLITSKFNQPLDRLPSGLETLIIKSGLFNQPIENLPSSVRHLVLLCPNFKQPLDMLPHGLEYFAGLHYNCFLYPESVYKGSLENLPSSLKHVMLDEYLFTRCKTDLEQRDGISIRCYNDYNNSITTIIRHLLDSIISGNICNARMLEC